MRERGETGKIRKGEGGGYAAQGSFNGGAVQEEMRAEGLFVGTT